MSAGIGTLEIKRQHGKLVVVALGKTPRGQNFIKDYVPLTVEKLGDPKFKTELAAAVSKMFGDEV